MQELIHFPLGVMAHAVTIVHNKDIHPGRVFQSRQQLRCEEEILSAVLLARGPDEQLKDPLLVGRVHPLVDLVHAAEGDGGQLLQGEHVQCCRHAPLATRLVKSDCS